MSPDLMWINEQQRCCHVCSRKVPHFCNKNIFYFSIAIREIPVLFWITFVKTKSIKCRFYI
jgi:hypothetical protein